MQEVKVEVDNIFAAVVWGNRGKVQEYLAAGCDVNARNEGGMTPLHLAVEHNQIAIMKLLIAAGADVNATDGHFFSNEIPFKLALKNPETTEILLNNKNLDLDKVKKLFWCRMSLFCSLYHWDDVIPESIAKKLLYANLVKNHLLQKKFPDNETFWKHFQHLENQFNHMSAYLSIERWRDKNDIYFNVSQLLCRYGDVENAQKFSQKIEGEYREKPEVASLLHDIHAAFIRLKGNALEKLDMALHYFPTDKILAGEFFLSALNTANKIDLVYGKLDVLLSKEISPELCLFLAAQLSEIVKSRKKNRSPFHAPAPVDQEIRLCKLFLDKVSPVPQLQEEPAAIAFDDENAVELRLLKTVIFDRSFR